MAARVMGEVGYASGRIVAALLLTCALLLAEETEEKMRMNPGRRYADKPPLDEAQRLRLFYERHGAWPDPKWLAKEAPEYSRRMAQRTEEVMRIDGAQARWNAWMQLAQARVAPRFTDTGFSVVRVPEAVHAKLLKRFHEELPRAGREPGSPDEPGRLVKGHAKFIHQEELNYEVQLELKDLFSEWAGVPLEDTVNYGVRVYEAGHTLRDHVDDLNVDVISGVLHIDDSLEAPFPIEMECFDGRRVPVNLKPGDLLVFESAKCFHQRSTPLQGRYYGSVYLHYRPIGWNMNHFDDASPAIPPWWNAGISNSTEGANAGGIPLRVTFHNAHTHSVELNWVSPEVPADGSPHHTQPIDVIPAGGSSVQSTWAGHSFVAIDQTDNSRQELFFMRPDHATADITIGAAWRHEEL